MTQRTARPLNGRAHARASTLTVIRLGPQRAPRHHVKDLLWHHRPTMRMRPLAQGCIATIDQNRVVRHQHQLIIRTAVAHHQGRWTLRRYPLSIRRSLAFAYGNRRDAIRLHHTIMHTMVVADHALRRNAKITRRLLHHPAIGRCDHPRRDASTVERSRSEEHTSELESR